MDGEGARKDGRREAGKKGRKEEIPCTPSYNLQYCFVINRKKNICKNVLVSIICFGRFLMPKGSYFVKIICQNI